MAYRPGPTSLYYQAVYDVGTLSWVAMTQPSISTGAISIAAFTYVTSVTTTTVAENAASVTLLSSKADRLVGTIFNGSDARLFVRLGTTADKTANFYRILLPGELWNFFDETKYSGRVDGIWESTPATGLAKAVINEG